MQHSDLTPGMVRLSTIRFRNRREKPIAGRISNRCSAALENGGDEVELLVLEPDRSRNCSWAIFSEGAWAAFQEPAYDY
jgi:hypothetical protein